MDSNSIFSVVFGVFLLLSESLPFIKINANGIIHLLINLRKLKTNLINTDTLETQPLNTEELLLEIENLKSQLKFQDIFLPNITN